LRPYAQPQNKCNAVAYLVAFLVVIYLIEAAPQNVGRNKKILDVTGVLFAYVARDSLEAGFDGFVAFHSKTILVNHYIRKYGAKVIRGDQLMFDTHASLRLIREYLGGNNGN